MGTVKLKTDHDNLIKTFSIYCVNKHFSPINRRTNNEPFAFVNKYEKEDDLVTNVGLMSLSCNCRSQIMLTSSVSSTKVSLVEDNLWIFIIV